MLGKRLMQHRFIFAKNELFSNNTCASCTIPLNLICRRTIMTTEEAKDIGIVVEIPEIRRFMVDCMEKVGTDVDQACQLADVLIAGDHRGHYSHGLNRLDMYVLDIEKKICKPSGTPKILNERAGTAWVDGDNLLGPVVGNFCMDLAIKKAKEAGVGWVSCKGSNHFGIAGWYSLNAMKAGMLGLAFTNTSPLTYPTRGGKAVLGTNPLTLAAPALNDDSFVLDMATTTVAVGKGMAFTNTSPVVNPTRSAESALGTNALTLAVAALANDSFFLDMATSTVAHGKIEMQQRKGESMPSGWGVDGKGHETHDPSEVLGGRGGLLPLGGKEITGGYKGYGLSMLVEIFCGILGGAHWGPNVRKWMDTAREADLGQCFIAVDPEAFAPGFPERMQELINTCRGLTPAEGETNVLVAGDPEREHISLCDQLGGIPYHPNQISHAIELANQYGITPMKTKTE